jgi:hypothetical protein
MLIDAKCAGLCKQLPLAWMRSELSERPQEAEMPTLWLPLADPVSFYDTHQSVLGINARNIVNIAPEVCAAFSANCGNTTLQAVCRQACGAKSEKDHEGQTWTPCCCQDFEEVDVAGKGLWQELPDGGRVWRLAITSPGASSNILVFR